MVTHDDKDHYDQIDELLAHGKVSINTVLLGGDDGDYGRQLYNAFEKYGYKLNSTNPGLDKQVINLKSWNPTFRADTNGPTDLTTNTAIPGLKCQAPANLSITKGS